MFSRKIKIIVITCVALLFLANGILAASPANSSYMAVGVYVDNDGLPAFGADLINKAVNSDIISKRRKRNIEFQVSGVWFICVVPSRRLKPLIKSKCSL